MTHYSLIASAMEGNNAMAEPNPSLYKVVPEAPVLVIPVTDVEVVASER